MEEFVNPYEHYDCTLYAPYIWLYAMIYVQQNSCVG